MYHFFQKKEADLVKDQLLIVLCRPIRTTQQEKLRQ